MLLKFWGTTGSIPAPLRPEQIEKKIVAALQTAGQKGIDLTDMKAIQKFVATLPSVKGSTGGNTTCFSIEMGNNLLIFDAGSGIRELGNRLMDGNSRFAKKFGFYKGEGRAHIFFTHTHWDHIQGLPFFIPLHVPGNAFDIYHVHDYVPKVMVRQMEREFFPKQFGQIDSTLRFHQLQEGEPIEIAGAIVSSIELKHPNKAYGYRIEGDDAIVVLATDAEYKDLGYATLKKYYKFYSNADVLIFDAMYSLREAFVKEDWGHSSALIGADIARSAHVKRLLLSHHDPIATDEEVLQVVQETQEYIRGKGEQWPEVMLAVEGLEMNLPEYDPAEDFHIQEQLTDGVIFMTLSGKFGAYATEQFKEHLEQSLSSYQTDKVILKMENLSELATAGIRTLLETRRTVKNLALVGVPENVFPVFKWAGVADFFAIYEKDEDALVAFEQLEHDEQQKLVNN